MCGEFFHAFTQKPADTRAYSAALGHMSRRGPDYQRLENHARFFIGHTRLAIIDTSDAGAQPFWDTERRFVLSYNGEIYNHAELRRDLEARGVLDEPAEGSGHATGRDDLETDEQGCRERQRREVE